MRFFNKILIIVVFLTVYNCSDFLTEVNKSAITKENYFTSSSQAKAAVSGVYSSLYSLHSGLHYGEAAWVSMELIVGHATTLGQSAYNNGLIHHNSSTIEPHFEVLWRGFYKGIANANLCIEKIPSIEMDEDEKNKLLGEVYFLRALYYYYLVQLYGDIPLITSSIDYSSSDLFPVKSKVDEIYDLIVSDLKNAENSGLSFRNSGGKVSLGAVKALLSSVYLRMAGYPLLKGEEYFRLAAQKSEDVIDSEEYSLFPNYNFLHDREHKNKEEFIFQVQYLYGVQSNNITEMVTPDKAGISRIPSEIGALVARDDFIKSYEMGDRRVLEKEFYFTEYPSISNPDNIVKFGEYALYKFWLEEAAGTGGDAQSDLNWTILRLPEIMLNYAEASNEIEGPNKKAYDQINLIRSRAGLEPLVDLSQNEFRDAIWKERYHELSFENKAYFDIQRTHKVYDLENGQFEDAFTFENESGTIFTEKYMLWPIPQSEIDANPNLIQNKDW